MIATIILTKNRVEMLKKCVSSLQHPLNKSVVFALPSKDNTEEVAYNFYKTNMIQSVVFEEATYYDQFTRGTYLVENWHPEIIHFCADDYVMHKDWLEKASLFLRNAPEVSHASLEMEPSFSWNQPSEILERGGVKALIRHTVPGANWIMLWDHWLKLRPYLEMRRNSLTWDHEINAVAREKFGKIAALGLAEHIGAYASSVGNRSFQMSAKPLPEKWRI